MLTESFLICQNALRLNLNPLSLLAFHSPSKCFLVVLSVASVAPLPPVGLISPPDKRLVLLRSMAAAWASTNEASGLGGLISVPGILGIPVRMRLFAKNPDPTAVPKATVVVATPVVPKKPAIAAPTGAKKAIVVSPYQSR